MAMRFNLENGLCPVDNMNGSVLSEVSMMDLSVPTV